MKLAVVGGGSTYTPELVAGLARERERLDLREVVLQDIDSERREIVGGLAKRMLTAAGYDGAVCICLSLPLASRSRMVPVAWPVASCPPASKRLPLGRSVDVCPPACPVLEGASPAWAPAKARVAARQN